MNLNRALSAVLLFAFAVFAAGGPGLHYAPFFGHHHHHPIAVEEQDEVASACGCGHHHNQEPGAATPVVSEGHGHSHDCDGHCLICQFFSSVTFEIVTEYSILSDESAIESIVLEIHPTEYEFVPAFYQRGPPLACFS